MANAASSRQRVPLLAYFVGLLVVFAVAAAAASAYVWLQTAHDARTAAEHDATYAAHVGSQQLANDVRTLRATAASLAANPQIGQVFAHPAGCTLSFSGGAGLPSGHLDLLRPDGSVACSSRAAHGGAKLSGYAGAPWLRRARQARLLEAPVRDAATGGESLLVTAPIHGGGIVAVFASLAPTGAALAREYGGGHPDEFLVVDGRGTVLARSIRPGRWIGRSVAGTALGGGGRRDLDGTSRLYGEAAVSGVGWTLLVGEDEHAALAPGVTLRWRELAIIVAGFLLATLATGVIYRRVALPIRRLSAAVAASDPYAGDEAAVPVSGPREVAGLGLAVNALFAGIGHDLQERRRLLEQLRHSQKMEALGRVAAGVAHDFNNVITVIAGFAGQIARATRDDPVLRAQAEEVGRAAERGAVLIRQLLLFSRRERVDPTVVDANDLIRGMESMLARLLDGTIRVRLETEADAAAVRADRGQLEQVLMNLAVNARDAMPAGGELRISTDNETLDPEEADALGLRPGRYVVVGVADTGTGMDAHVREHLFEPFFTTKPPGEGTGLGLATSYGIVSEAGGKIDVWSEPGAGSRFSVYLPLAETEARGRPAVAPAPPAGAGRTVLLVEDDAGLRALAQTVLEGAGFRVLDARFGEEALWVADRHEGRIDVLLTDSVMPVMNGRELAERLLDLHPEMRVVFMSGHERDTVLGSDQGTAFLAKPFTPDRLVETVGAALGRR